MDSLDIALPVRNDPLVLPWPLLGNRGGFIQFEHGDQWRVFIRSFDVNPSVPEIVRLRYTRAQKLYLLGWFDADLIKAGELVALIALELAAGIVTDGSCANHWRKRGFAGRRKFGNLLNRLR